MDEDDVIRVVFVLPNDLGEVPLYLCAEDTLVDVQCRIIDSKQLPPSTVFVFGNNNNNNGADGGDVRCSTVFADDQRVQVQFAANAAAPGDDDDGWQGGGFNLVDGDDDNGAGGDGDGVEVFGQQQGHRNNKHQRRPHQHKNKKQAQAGAPPPPQQPRARYMDATVVMQNGRFGAAWTLACDCFDVLLWNTRLCRTLRNAFHAWQRVYQPAATAIATVSRRVHHAVVVRGLYGSILLPAWRGSTRFLRGVNRAIVAPMWGGCTRFSRATYQSVLVPSWNATTRLSRATCRSVLVPSWNATTRLSRTTCRSILVPSWNASVNAAEFAWRTLGNIYNRSNLYNHTDRLVRAFCRTVIVPSWNAYCRVTNRFLAICNDRIINPIRRAIVWIARDCLYRCARHCIRTVYRIVVGSLLPWLHRSILVRIHNLLLRVPLSRGFHLVYDRLLLPFYQSVLEPLSTWVRDRLILAFLYRSILRPVSIWVGNNILLRACDLFVDRVLHPFIDWLWQSPWLGPFLRQAQFWLMDDWSTAGFYGVAIRGRKRQVHTDAAGNMVVTLVQDSTYQICLRSTHPYNTTLCRLSVDGYDVGIFVLRPRQTIVVERPVSTLAKFTIVPRDQKDASLAHASLAGVEAAEQVGVITAVFCFQGAHKKAAPAALRGREAPQQQQPPTKTKTKSTAHADMSSSSSSPNMDHSTLHHKAEEMSHYGGGATEEMPHLHEQEQDEVVLDENYDEDVVPNGAATVLRGECRQQMQRIRVGATDWTKGFRITTRLAVAPREA